MSLQNTSHAVYSTFNNGTDILVNFRYVTHVIADTDATKGAWIWFSSGKSVHVADAYPYVLSDLTTFLDNH